MGYLVRHITRFALLKVGSLHSSLCCTALTILLAGENTTIFAGIQTPENIYSVTIHSDPGTHNYDMNAAFRSNCKNCFTPGKFLLIPFEDLVTYAGVNWLRGNVLHLNKNQNLVQIY